jgi:hypothetical protein
MATNNPIPGFNPNRGNFYVPKPDTPAVKTDGGSNSSNSNAAGSNADPANPAPAGSFLSLTGPGWGGPSSQQISDWATVAGSNQPYAAAYNRATGQQTPVDLAKMRSDVETARQRLGPVGAASADFVGTTANPTNLLTAVPVVGPGLAGAAQSAFTDYGAGKDWPTIGKDALVGGALGEASLGLVQPKVAGNAAARLTDIGGGTVGGALLGHGWGSEYTIPGMIGAGAALHKGAERVGQWTEDALNNPTAQRALQQLLYGGAMSAKPQSMPPLPGFASMGN